MWCTRLDNTCNPGSYSDFASGQCLPCATNCGYCTGPKHEDCTNCNDPKFLNNATGNCVDTCPSGTYGNVDSTANPDLRVCKPCTSPCATCTTDATTCATCISEYYLKPNNTCVADCGSDEYEDSGDGRCKDCNSYCNSEFACSGPNTDECDKCDGAKFEEDGDCVDSCTSPRCYISSSKVCAASDYDGTACCSSINPE